MKTEKYEVTREYSSNDQLNYEEYRLEGKLHNTNGPAIRCWDKNGQLNYEEYWLNGKFHNTNGPAYRSWNKNGKLASENYWLNGKKLTKEEFENRKNCVENKVVEIDGKKYKLVEIEIT